MKIILPAILLMFLLANSGCKKDSSNPASGNDQYSNKLNLGSGADYSKFQLTGEGINFYRLGGTAIIFWRLESVADMGGSPVNIKIEKQSGNTYVNDTTFSFSNPQSYGHIIISSFSLAKAGNFRATGILVNGNISVATKEFTVQ